MVRLEICDLIMYPNRPLTARSTLVRRLALTHSQTVEAIYDP